MRAAEPFRQGARSGTGPASPAASFILVFPPEGAETFGRERSQRPAIAVGTAEEGGGFGVVDDLALQRVALGGCERMNRGGR